MAWEQKEMSREVSLMLTPTLDLNHWRFSSTSVISAMGASQMFAASSVRSSKISSGTVSSTEYCQSTLSRFFSSLGMRGRVIKSGRAMIMVCRRKATMEKSKDKRTNDEL